VEGAALALGATLGTAEGLALWLGPLLGNELGELLTLGVLLGKELGAVLKLGAALGVSEGAALALGPALGDSLCDRLTLGAALGTVDGALLKLGAELGTGLGATLILGSALGAALGALLKLGAALGLIVGALLIVGKVLGVLFGGMPPLGVALCVRALDSTLKSPNARTLLPLGAETGGEIRVGIAFCTARGSSIKNGMVSARSGPVGAGNSTSVTTSTTSVQVPNPIRKPNISNPLVHSNDVHWSLRKHRRPLSLLVLGRIGRSAIVISWGRGLIGLLVSIITSGVS